MNTIILYIAKSILVSGALTSLYWLVLRNRKMHHYNRFFLLFTLVCSAVLPLCHFNWFTAPQASLVSISGKLFTTHAMGGDYVPAIATASNTHSVVDWGLLIMAACYVISAVLVSGILLRAISVYRLRNKYPCTKMDGFRLINTDLSQAPFSFFNCIFWKNSIPTESENGQMILCHELVHVQQKHSFDKLFSQLLTAIFWINPFYLIIGRELTMIHEFIADGEAVPSTNTAVFARMLLQTHCSHAFFTPEHQFFSSPIKRRLTMLQTNKTRYRVARGMLVLPVLAGLLTLFSFTSKKEFTLVKAARKLVIVVDAGHGGIDAGASHAGIREKDLNLKIARRIEELSSKYNIETHLTRTDDDGPTLAQRVDFTNNLHPDAFISVHVNDNKTNIDNGNFDVIVNMDNKQAEKSQVLGWAVYQQLKNAGCTLRKNHLSNERLYVCTHSTSPAILLELGDIKRSADIAMLTDDAKLDNICNAILKGVVASAKN